MEIPHGLIGCLPQLLRAETLLRWQQIADAPCNSQFIRLIASCRLAAQYFAKYPQSICLVESAINEQTSFLSGIHLLLEHENETDFMRELRHLRHQEIIRIAWRSLNRHAELPETLGELSQLAESVLEIVYQWSYRKLSQRFGVPRSQDDHSQQHLMIFAFGKLGGGELNFSSDIDLLFAFPNRGETDGERELDSAAFFHRVAQMLVRLINEQTPDGFVFRVDLRLRPFGESGALVMSSAAIVHYYQTHGRGWERYALVKLRPVAGDLGGGWRLIESLTPFIYHHKLDYSALEDLRNIKSVIMQQVEKKEMQRNVKLGRGGIREIEFIIQALQIIYGGRLPELRCNSLFTALEQLTARECLLEEDSQRLREAYCFLRRLENCLQIVDDAQTHELPYDATAKMRLAYMMNISDWKLLVAELLPHVAAVQALFAQVVDKGENKKPNALLLSASSVELQAVWQHHDEPEEALRTLRKQGFEQAEQLLQGLEHFYQRFYLPSGETVQKRLDQVIPYLLILAGEMPRGSKPLQRALQLLEVIIQTPEALALLVENSHAVQSLMNLCNASPGMSSFLLRNPVLVEELLLPTGGYLTPLTSKRLQAAMQQQIENYRQHGKDALNALRYFRHSQLFRIALADIGGSIQLMRVSDHITELAEIVLRETLHQCWKELTAKYGEPYFVRDDQRYPAEYSIVAYGKMGGIELGYMSDLDLVFLHNSQGEEQVTDGGKSIANEVFFTRLTQRLIHVMTERTDQDSMYNIDPRLRPQGESGSLVNSLEAFYQYQTEKAWIWEHQALMRARPVAGSLAMAQRFRQIRQEILTYPRDSSTLCAAVTEMRDKMRQSARLKAGEFHLKQGYGGIIDIEFLTQYLVLTRAHDHPVLVQFTDNVRQLAGLEATGILRSGDAGILRETYRLLRHHQHQLVLREEPRVLPDHELVPQREAIIALWDSILIRADYNPNYGSLW